MKKSTKTLLVGLLVAPLAFTMVGCNGGEVSIVDTKGNYTEATLSNYAGASEVLNNETISEDFNSYRMIMNIDMNMTVSMSGMGEYKGGMKISNDSTINLLDGFDMKSVSKIKYIGYLADMQKEMEMPVQQTFEQYYSNGQGYIWDDEYNQWFEGDVQDADDQPVFDFSGLFEGTTELEQEGINVWIDSNEETGVTKIKMTMAAGVLEAFASENGEGFEEGAEITWGTAEVYYVLTNGKLEGMKVSIPYSVSTNESGVEVSADCKVTMQVAKTDAVVEFPEGMGA
ncbi:MAG: hypothetical protein J6C53_00090 [Clostridia bacterium]|nr:hypothetical protein [Clostridia bacterium]